MHTTKQEVEGLQGGDGGAVEIFCNKDGKEIKRQATEIYSRVVGYLSPIHRWNNGKKEEFKDRKVFRIK